MLLKKKDRSAFVMHTSSDMGQTGLRMIVIGKKRNKRDVCILYDSLGFANVINEIQPNE